jgi:putative transposase
MEILQGYKYKLLPKRKQHILMKKTAGCCRLVWNKVLNLEEEHYQKTGKRLGYNEAAALLVEWKKEKKTSFLSEVPSQTLQQSLKDQDRAYTNFFKERAKHPKYKKKGEHDSFRFPQGFEIDEENSRIFLPKIGWMRYKNSREVEGTAKQITVSCYAGEWFFSVQTEREVEDPQHSSFSYVGIDMGVSCFAALSDGTMIEPINALRKYEKKLSHEMKALSRKVRYSSRWYKQKLRIQKLHKKIADIRRNYLHQISSLISKNHALVVMEDLKVKNMSKSASGSVENPGKNVSAKSGLNKSILDQGWYEFRRQIEYKLRWRGGVLMLVPPQYTSQRCSSITCGHTESANRTSRDSFSCVRCGLSMHADLNAARNILAAGLAVNSSPSGKGSSAHAEARTQPRDPSSS